MELVGIEFEANEGQNSYIDLALTYCQDSQNFRNRWKSICAGNMCVLHYREAPGTSTSPSKHPRAGFATVY